MEELRSQVARLSSLVAYTRLFSGSLAPVVLVEDAEERTLHLQLKELI